MESDCKCEMMLSKLEGFFFLNYLYVVWSIYT